MPEIGSDQIETDALRVKRFFDRSLSRGPSVRIGAGRLWIRAVDTSPMFEVNVERSHVAREKSKAHRAIG